MALTQKRLPRDLSPCWESGSVRAKQGECPAEGTDRQRPEAEGPRKHLQKASFPCTGLR